MEFRQTTSDVNGLNMQSHLLTTKLYLYPKPAIFASHDAINEIGWLNYQNNYT